MPVQLASIAKDFLHNRVIIDNFIFRLHYLYSLRLFFAMTCLAVYGQFWGDYFLCSEVSALGMPMKAIETHCISDVFIILRALIPKFDRGTYTGVTKTERWKDKFFLTHYQWIPFAMLFQCALFYVPRSYWKSAEKGAIKSFVKALNAIHPGIPKNIASKTLNAIAEDFMDYKRKNNRLLLAYWFAEFLNIVLVVVQFAFTTILLKGKFLYYGPEVLSRLIHLDCTKLIPRKFWLSLPFAKPWADSYREYLIEQLFPLKAKCILSDFGHSGDIQLVDTVCYLNHNKFYRWVFFFLWFWYAALFILSVCTFLYRFCTICFPRFYFFCSHSHDVYFALQNCSAGDYFVLNLIRKNLTRRSLFVKFVGKIQLHNNACRNDFAAINPNFEELSWRVHFKDTSICSNFFRFIGSIFSHLFSFVRFCVVGFFKFICSIFVFFFSFSFFTFFRSLFNHCIARHFQTETNPSTLPPNNDDELEMVTVQLLQE